MIEEEIKELQDFMWKMKGLVDELPYYLVGRKNGEDFYIAVFSSEYLLERFVRSCKNKDGGFKKKSVMGEFENYEVRRYYIPKDLPFDLEG